MITTTHARRLLTETGEMNYPVFILEDGLILRVEQEPANGSTETLTASFFDIHVHGGLSHDFMAASAAEIHRVGHFLATHGVAHYLPTTVTSSVDATLRALDVLADGIEEHGKESAPSDCAAPVGIHLEGPFVSHAKRGVHPSAYLLKPEPGMFDRFQQAARGHIRLLTMAPELPGALELIEHVAATGVRVSLGHTDATEVEALRAVERGALSATHTFNAMGALNHREPGVLGVVLDSSSLYAELICDGIHVHPALVRLWLKMKGQERAILVTDGMSATGMPDGVYQLGDLSVEVKDGVCLLEGTLAGSTLTMDLAVDNLRRFTGTALGGVVRLASYNPARMLGMEHLTRIEAGSPANFNVYDEAGRLCASILRGQRLQV